MMIPDELFYSMNICQNSMKKILYFESRISFPKYFSFAERMKTWGDTYKNIQIENDPVRILKEVPYFQNEMQVSKTHVDLTKTFS